MKYFILFLLFNLSLYCAQESSSSSSNVKKDKKNLSNILADEIQSSYTQAGINTIKGDLKNSINECLSLINKIDTLNVDELNKGLEDLKKLEDLETDENIKNIIIATIQTIKATIKKAEKALESRIVFPTDASNLILEYLGYDFIEIFSDFMRLIRDRDKVDLNTRFLDIQLIGDTLKFYIISYEELYTKNFSEVELCMKTDECQVKVCEYWCNLDGSKYYLSPNKKYLAILFAHNVSIESKRNYSFNLYFFDFIVKEITSMAWSTNSKKIACGLSNGTIKIDKFHFSVSKKLESPICKEAISSLAFSPDDSLLATSSGNNLFIWQINSNTIIQHIDGPCKNLCWSKCGQYLAYEKDNGNIFILDLQKDNEIYLFTSKVAISCMSWALDSPRLVIGFIDSSFKVWSKIII